MAMCKDQLVSGGRRSTVAFSSGRDDFAQLNAPDDRQRTQGGGEGSSHI